jgi:hypothetical protein
MTEPIARGRSAARLLLGLVLLGPALAACGGEPLATADPALLQYTPSYERDVAPLLAERCISCHSKDGVRDGGVELDSWEPVWAGRVKHVCVSITPELIAESADVLALHPKNPPVQTPPCGDYAPLSMPTGAVPKLTAAEQQVLVGWLRAGAPR